MGALFGTIIKSIMTEKVLKSIMVVLGDYLVKSSKNSLDDLLWEKVKKVLVK